MNFVCSRYSAVTRGALNSGMGMIRTERTRGEPESAGIGLRVAVYPRSGEPEVTEVAAANPGSATAKFTRLVMDEVKAVGGKAPEEAVREVVENLVHAGYQGVVISVLEGGNVVRVSDKGPGVQHKDRAMEFGFSGVTLEDNIGGGTVTTISVAGGGEVHKEQEPSLSAPRRYPDGVPRMNISERQQKVLVTVLECGEVGPSTVAERLEISVSTASRDLSVLEE